MYLECSVYNCGRPIPVSMLRVNTRVETQGDRTGGEERLNRGKRVRCFPPSLDSVLLSSPSVG